MNMAFALSSSSATSTAATQLQSGPILTDTPATATTMTTEETVGLPLAPTTTTTTTATAIEVEEEQVASSMSSPLNTHLMMQRARITATIATALRNAAQSNSMGIGYLTTHQVGNALTSFRHALQHLESIGPLVTLPQVEDGNHHQARPPPQNINNWMMMNERQQQQVPNNNPMAGHPFFRHGPFTMDSVLVPRLQDDIMYIYNRAQDFAMDVQERQAASSSNNTSSSSAHQHHQEQLECFGMQVTLYSSLILFNIALVMHHKGMARRHTTSRDTHLVNAIHFYDICIRSLSQIMPLVMMRQDPASADDKITMLMLSIWNNQSQIYYELASYESAFELLEGVRQLSSRLLWERQPPLNDQDQQHIYDFLLNVAILRVPIAAPCA